MKRKTKQTIKTILLSLLGVGVVVGVGAGINALVEKQDDELKTIHPTFIIGSLDENGKFEESTSSIYTKNAFECLGLEIKVDFDNCINYQVFFYEADGDFLSTTPVMEGNNEITTPKNATHARLEVTPNWTKLGDDYAEEENQVVKWYEISKYSSQLEISVLAVQNGDVTADLYFYPDGKDFEFSIKFEQGMTWAEWLESDYNDSNLILHDGYVIYDDEGDFYNLSRTLVGDDTIIDTHYVKGTDIISSKFDYVMLFEHEEA